MRRPGGCGPPTRRGSSDGAGRDTASDVSARASERRLRAPNPTALALFAVLAWTAPARGQSPDAAPPRDAAADSAMLDAGPAPDARVLDAATRTDATTDAAAPVADAPPLTPIIDAGVPSPASVSAAPPRERSTASLMRVTLGLFALLALTVLGAHPSVRALERRTGLAMVTGSGLPFLALGFVARHPAVGILDDAMLLDLRPLMEFGLAWIGFRVGTEFNVRQMDHWPPGTVRLMFIESACAFLAVAVGVGAALRVGMYSPAWVRNALILGACAAVSAPSGVRALEHGGLMRPEVARAMRRVAALDDVMALLVLALVTSAFRPLTSDAWALPPLGWLFLQIGMGVVLGGVTVGALRIASNAHEEFAMTLGAVAFTAGLGSAVGFSPLVVACVAGVVVENLQVSARTPSSLTTASRMRELERTVYLAFFVVVGAMWQPSIRAGWLLLPVYVFARLGGKLLGVRAARADVMRPAEGPMSDGDVRAHWVSLMPASAVSIALVVSAQTAYPSILRGSLETVVIVGALASEILFRAGTWLLGGRVSGDDADLGALALRHEDPDEPEAPP